MTTIRIGNDIHVRWSVFSRNGAPYVLDGAVIRLWLLSGPFKKRITDYSIAENVVSFLVDAKDLHRYGIYKLVLSLTDSASQTEDTAFDFTEVFQIVSKTYSGSTDAVLDGDVVVTPSSIIDNVVENYVTNAADGEDLTTVNNLLKFRDRMPGDGMGYVILRSNKTFAEQVIYENTIYEIRYDFDLDGESVTIPADCTIKFNGGKIQNGTMAFNNTTIKCSENLSDVCSADIVGKFVTETVDETITFRIPTDFPDLQSAFDYVSAIKTKEGAEIVLLIESDHELTGGLKVINGDHSNIRIIAEDDVVQLSENFSGVTATDSLHPNLDSCQDCLFIAINCRFPTIGALFDMTNLQSDGLRGDGIAAYNSNIYVNYDCGVINAGRFGIYAKDASTVMAGHTKWSGSNYSAIRLQHATCGYFVSSELNGCHKVDYDQISGYNNLGVVYVSKQCICQVRESEIKNSPYGYGLLVRRSRVDFELSTIENCRWGIYAEGGAVVSANGTLIDGITTGASVCATGSIVFGLISCRNNSHNYNDFVVRSGGMILGARQSTHAADDELTIKPIDCSPTVFNSFTENGIICGKNTRPGYLMTGTSTSGYLIEYPNSATFSIRKLVAASVNSGAYAIVQSGIDIPTGYTINSVSVNALGNQNANGGGKHTMVNVTSDLSSANIVVYNTGVCTDGTTTSQNIASVYLDVSMILIPV